MNKGALLARLLGKNENEINPQEVLHDYLNIMLAGEATLAQPLEEDYRGCWEDAFLLNGYENGKHSFLTGFVAMSIKRHGFKVSTEAHKDARIIDHVDGRNIIITGLLYNGENCIPDKTTSGDPVILGVTDPRAYLPREIQVILDDEFGYDRDIYDPHR